MEPRRGAVSPAPAVEAARDHRGKEKAAKAPRWLEAAVATFKVVWRVFPKCTFVPALVLVAVVHSGASGPIGQVSRMMGALADVVEGGSSLALDGLEASAGFTSEVASWSRKALSSGHNVLASFMEGIDIVNVTVERKRARVVTTTGSAFATWVRTAAADRVAGTNVDARLQLAATAEAVSFWMPVVETERVLYSPLFEYGLIGVKAAYLPSGRVEIRWELVTANYVLEWANPLWEALGFNPASEAIAVQKLVHGVVASLPANSDFNVTSDAVVLPVLPAALAQLRRWGTGIAFTVLGPPPGLQPPGKG